MSRSPSPNLSPTSPTSRRSSRTRAARPRSSASRPRSSRSPATGPPKTLRTSSPGRPLAVGITGGIGAGKSEALKAFARHGAATISSDDVVHRLLREDEEVRGALIGRFGPRVILEDGEVDRRAIGEIVFENREELVWLEQLLHPRVAQEYYDWRDRLARLPEPPAVCATEVPLLYEVG